MIRIQQIKMPLKHNKNDIELKIRRLLRLKPDQEFSFHIFKQSIDARRKSEVVYVYTVDVMLKPDDFSQDLDQKQYFGKNQHSEINQNSGKNQHSEIKQQFEKKQHSEKNQPLEKSRQLEKRLYFEEKQHSKEKQCLTKERPENCSLEKKLVQKLHNKNIMLTKRNHYTFPKTGQAELSCRPVIAGSGPAGLFCA